MHLDNLDNIMKTRALYLQKEQSHNAKLTAY